MVDAHDDEVYSAKNSRLIWIDCEMTGLDIFHDELCEISVVPTDFELNVLDEGIDFNYVAGVSAGADASSAAGSTASVVSASASISASCS